MEEQLVYRLDNYKYSDTSKNRVLSGIRQLDYDLKGFEMGGITIWTGFTNAGKTTVMTMLAKNIIQQGERIFFFNGEQTKEDFKNRLYIQSSSPKDLIHKQFKNSCVYDTFVNSEKAVLLEKLYGNKIFIFNNKAERDIYTLIKAMSEVKYREKIRVFFLDNFMQIETKTSDEYREQKDIMEQLRKFAINENVHIHLVAHPRKIERLQTRLSLYDIAGSSNLVNKAYNIISILRKDTIQRNPKDYEKMQQELLAEGYDIENVDTILEVLKEKGERSGLVGLKFIKETKTYIESPTITSEEKEKIIRKKEELPW